MSTDTETLAEKILGRATYVAAVALLLTVVAVATYYVKDRYFQPSVSLVDEAVLRLEEVVRNAPDNPQARLAVADAYLAKKMYDDAISQYEEALRLSEDNQGALLGLARTYEAKKDDERAVEYFKKLVDLNEGSDYQSVNKRLNIAHYELGRIYLKQDRVDEAIEEFKQALLIDRTDADALLLLGNAFEKKKSWGDAIVAYDAATKFDIEFSEAYKGLARAYRGVGEGARAAYAEAMVSFAAKNYDDAIKRLEAVAPSVQDFADLYFGLGMAYQLKGQTGKAIDAYQKAVDIDPNHRMAQANLRQLKP